MECLSSKEYCCIAQPTGIYSKVMLFCGQIEFEDESWLSVRREDVYKASEELPLNVQQRLVSKEQSRQLLALAVK